MNILNFRWMLILAIAVLWVAPRAGVADPSGDARTPWFVTYQDGSGNGYRFSKDSDGEQAYFEYSPIQPHDSSTGMYSGGKPARGVLSPKQIKKLWQRILGLESDATLRADARVKGSGAFLLKDPTGSREFLISSGPQLADWNQFLSEFRRGEQGIVVPRN